MREKLNRDDGSIFTVLLAGIALTAVIGVASFNVLTGPVATMAKSNLQQRAQGDMDTISNIVLSVSGQAGGDCDVDGYIEPAPYDEPVAGNRFIPSTIGAPQIDPWGSNYKYCPFDVGTTADAACGGAAQKRYLGSPTPGVGKDKSRYVFAVISSGPDRTFQSTCQNYVDGNTAVVTPGGDDLVQTYTYAQAVAASPLLWTLNATDPTKAETNKINVELQSTPADCAGLGTTRFNDPASGHCYYFVSDPSATAATATTGCAASGAHMASITSASEDSIIGGVLGANAALVGGSDAALEGDWKWTDTNTSFWSGLAAGSAVGGAYTNWCSGEPDNYNGENQIMRSGTTPFEGQARLTSCWGDVADTYGYASKKGYVCEKDGAPPKATMSATTGLGTFNQVSSTGLMKAQGGVVVGNETQATTCGPNPTGMGTLRYNNDVGNGFSIATSGLIHYWTLDETSGTTVTDTAGTINGSWSPGSIVTTAGKNNGAYSFDGAHAAYIGDPGASNLDISNGSQITVSFWARASLANDGTYSYLFSLVGGGNEIYNLAYDGGVTFRYRDSGGSMHVYTGPNSWTKGSWYYVTLGYTYGDGSSIKLYLNGEPLAGSWAFGDGTGIPPTIDGTIYVGYLFKGDIDDIRMYNRQLNDTEVQQLYRGSVSGAVAGLQFCDGTTWKKIASETSALNGTSTGVDAYWSKIANTDDTPPASGLIHHWKMDEATGTVLTDAIGARNGTYTGATNVTPADGMKDGAIYFPSGTQGNIAETGTTDLDIPAGTPFTFAFWYKMLPGQSTPRFFEKGTSGQNYTFTLIGSSAFNMSQNGGGTYRASYKVDPNRWNHVVVSETMSNAASMKVYVNGQPISGSWTSGTGNETPTVNDFSLYLMRATAGAYMDDFRMYNRQLSDAEVLSLYRSTGGGGIYRNTGTVMIGTNVSDPTTVFASQGTSGSGGNTGIHLYNYSPTDPGATIEFIRARGTENASATLSTGDSVGGVNFYARASNAWVLSNSIIGVTRTTFLSTSLNMSNNTSFFGTDETYRPYRPNIGLGTVTPNAASLIQGVSNSDGGLTFTSTGTPELQLLRARNDPTTPAAAKAEDTAGAVQVLGYDSNSYNGYMPGIYSYIDSTSASKLSHRLILYPGADTNTDSYVNGRGIQFFSNGNLGWGLDANSMPARQTFHMSGGLTVSPPGSATSPGSLAMPSGGFLYIDGNAGATRAGWQPQSWTMNNSAEIGNNSFAFSPPKYLDNCTDGAIAGVNVVQGATGVVSSATSFSRTFSSTPASGSTIIATVGVALGAPNNMTTMPTVTDNKGNTYKLVSVSDNNASGVASYIFAAENIPAPSATFTVTYTSPNPGNYTQLYMSIYEVAGLAAQSIDVGGASGLDANTSTTIYGDRPTSQPNEFVISTMFVRTPGGYTPSFGVSSGYTIGGGYTFASESSAQDAFKTITTNRCIPYIKHTHSTPSTGTTGAIAAFKAANAGTASLAAASGYASGLTSFVLGAGSTATNDNAIVIGHNSNSTGVGAITIGRNSTSSGAGSIAIGTGNLASGSKAIALGGTNNTARGANSIAMGANANTTVSATNTIGLNLSSSSVDFTAPNVFSVMGAKVGIGKVNPGTTLDIIGEAASPSATWTISSDIRLKDVHGPYTKGLQDILRLDPVRFHYKKDNPRGNDSTKQYVGLIAQDVEPIFPEAVSLEKDGYYSFHMQPINIAMINAMQELSHTYDDISAANDKAAAAATRANQKMNVLDEDLDRLQSAEQSSLPLPSGAAIPVILIALAGGFYLQRRKGGAP